MLPWSRRRHLATMAILNKFSTADFPLNTNWGREILAPA